jgi:membrane-bound lytic murein transglycosylase D
VENNSPVAPSNSSQRIIHTVAAGENLFRIGQKYGVSVEEIMKLNKLHDNNIKVGQKLIINKP